MKYDDASWHSGGDFPEDSPQEYAGTHIALFLRWCFTKGWIGKIHLDESPEDAKLMAQGNLSAVDYFFKYCDGKLTDDDLDKEGNVFADKYYGEDGLYLDDYAQHFGDLMYVAPESAHDFKKYSVMMEKRLKSGSLTKKQLKPCWNPFHFLKKHKADNT